MKDWVALNACVLNAHLVERLLRFGQCGVQRRCSHRPWELSGLTAIRARDVAPKGGVAALVSLMRYM
jgi:hypothetical protein